MKLNLEFPINSLSFGNVSINFLKELYKKRVDANLFVMGDRADFSAFDRLNQDAREWIVRSANHRFENYDPNVPVLKIWHINGAQNRVANKQYLYTFYECDSPTPQEVSIVKAQEHVFFSSSFATELFKERGCENVSYVPLGFDEDMDAAPVVKIPEAIHFGLIGKFEKRKNTEKIIKCWVELFGDKLEYQLTLLVGNPFISDEENNNALSVALGRKLPNVNVLSRITTNTEMSSLYKSIDIDLSGLSSGEGWNLPSFNATCLGKWSVVSRYSSHLDWAEDDNCIFVEPDGKCSNEDGKFFIAGGFFNQGNFAVLSEDSIKQGMLKAVEKFKVKPRNKKGEGLRERFTYGKTISHILERIS